MKKCLVVSLLAVGLVAHEAAAQSSFILPLSVRNGSVIQALQFGVSPINTVGVDRDTTIGPYFEAAAPPKPPAYQLDARFMTIPGRTPTYPTGLGSGVFKDIRDYRDPAQVDSFLVEISGSGAINGLAQNPTVVSWPASIADLATSWEIKSVGSGVVPATDMTSTMSVTIPPDIFGSTYFLLIIKQGATERPGPVASVTNVIRQAGVSFFSDANANPAVNVNFTAVGDSGLLQVSRYEEGPSNVSFSGTAPANVSQYRWVLTNAGLSGAASEVRFAYTKFPSGVTTAGTVTVYRRESEGAGAFTELTTAVFGDELRATTAAFGEFIFGSNDNPLTDVAEQPAAGIPTTMELEQNYPNPFNPATQIRFGVPATALVTLTVYNVLGQEVATLLSQRLEPGRYSATFDASGLSSGIYVYRLTVGSGALTQKMMFVK